MITDLRRLLTDARGERKAVAAFSCYDAETAVAVLRAAAGAPVVMLVPAALVHESYGELLVAGLRGIAERATGPVCLELDHAHGLDEVEAACAWGVGAVMIDGSRLPFRDNVELVLAARAIASRHNVVLEAALGWLAGEEDVAERVGADSSGLTELSDVQDFMAAARPDCLAVAVGNVHGIYRDPPALRASGIRAIGAAAEVPLVLHGGSGLPEATIERAVASGIAKVNFNTELRQAYFRATQRRLPGLVDGARCLDFHRSQVDAVVEVASQRLAARWCLARSHSRFPYGSTDSLPACW